MKLRDLLSGYPEPFKVIGLIDCFISGLCCDSRKVCLGDLFIALRGGQEQDRHQFVGQAVERGAVALIVEEPVTVSIKIPQVIVRNSRACLSYIAQNWYGNPAEKLINVGVTGTNGKSSVADFYYQILNLNNKKVASIGTLGVKSKKFKKKLTNTTIDSIKLSKILSNLKKKKLIMLLWKLQVTV